MSEYLKTLKKLTEDLPPFPTKLNSRKYEMEKGECLGWHLYDNPLIGVHRWFNSKGTIFPQHAHEEEEWFFIYSGEMHLKTEREEVILKEKEWWYNETGLKHGAFFPIDTYYLTITMPPNKEFPNA